MHTLAFTMATAEVRARHAPPNGAAAEDAGRQVESVETRRSRGMGCAGLATAARRQHHRLNAAAEACMTRRKFISPSPKGPKPHSAEESVREPRRDRIHPTRARTAERRRDSETVDNERADDDGMVSRTE